MMLFVMSFFPVLCLSVIHKASGEFGSVALHQWRSAPSGRGAAVDLAELRNNASLSVATVVAVVEPITTSCC